MAERPERSSHSKRDFLAIPDFSTDELYALLQLAADMKAGRYTDRPLNGKSMALIFEKSSTRTRVSFEVGTYQLGGQPLFLSSRDIQLGRGEPLKDTARVLSRYVHGMMVRTFGHDRVEELARFATVPVINGLTDLLHPCQIMADLLTVQEEFGDGLKDRRIAWIGDGNNMANSWINAAYRFGFELRLACPEGYRPDAAMVDRARTHANVLITADPREAAQDADVINTDVWTSMGQEAETEARMKAFQGYFVDAKLMALAHKDAISCIVCLRIAARKWRMK
jgi:ornithine carbamoyltransferase